jgi:hypothetical protein
MQSYSPDAQLTGFSTADADLQPVNQEMITRYLQYECRYRMCKYKNDQIKTWGELIALDYAHFLFLMSTEVGLSSNTFLALKGYLRGADVNFAMSNIRRRDTKEGQDSISVDFLALVCSHRGRMNGKTWGEIRDKDYSYFVWAIGNTMGRETKSFQVFYDCMNLSERLLVAAAPKGQVRVPKGLKYEDVVVIT